MKSSVLIFVLFFACVTFLYGQEKTTGISTTTDSKGEQLTAASVGISNTEDVTPQSGMIIINPLKFLTFCNLSYYTKVSAKGVLGIGMQLPMYGSINDLGINAEYRIYPLGRAPHGLYIAPSVSYNDLTYRAPVMSRYSAGLLIGWQWFTGNNFALGLGVGLNYYEVNSSYKGDGTNKIEGNPAVRFDIGYAW